MLMTLYYASIKFYAATIYARTSTLQRAYNTRRAIGAYPNAYSNLNCTCL